MRLRLVEMQQRLMLIEEVVLSAPDADDLEIEEFEEHPTRLIGRAEAQLRSAVTAAQAVLEAVDGAQESLRRATQESAFAPVAEYWPQESPAYAFHEHRYRPL